MSECVYVCMFVCECVVCMYVYKYIYIYICIDIYLSVCLTVCILIHPSILSKKLKILNRFPPVLNFIAMPYIRLHIFYFINHKSFTQMLHQILIFKLQTDISNGLDIQH